MTNIEIFIEDTVSDRLIRIHALFGQKSIDIQPVSTVHKKHPWQIQAEYWGGTCIWNPWILPSFEFFYRIKDEKTPLNKRNQAMKDFWIYLAYPNTDCIRKISMELWRSRHRLLQSTKNLRSKTSEKPRGTWNLSRTSSGNLKLFRNLPQKLRGFCFFHILWGWWPNRSCRPRPEPDVCSALPALVNTEILVSM